MVLARYSENITVQEFYDVVKERLELTLISGDEGLSGIIQERSINRPALALTGYYKYFANKRIQLFGAGEMGYLRDQSVEQQYKRLEKIVEAKIPCMVVSRNLAPTKAMLRVAEEKGVPLFRTPLKSKNFVTEATVMIEEHFAPKDNLHGTLMDIKGIGTLMRGQSGVGKSECALALIERGYSLVADDLVYVKRMGDRDVLGYGSEFGRGYMECRGLGILNIADLFGVRAVRKEKRVDLVITFTEWQPGVNEERVGLDKHYFNILGIDIPHIVIYVRPGRDLARLVEVASMVEALSIMGHDSVKEFNDSLIAKMQQGEKKN